MPLVLAKAPMWLIVSSVCVGAVVVGVFIANILIISGWNPRFLRPRSKATKEPANPQAPERKG